MSKIKLMLGDNIESLKKLPDNSIDSVVTDPPYGLSFMNKKWDYDVPSVEFWKELYRVLKPGGHVLSFGGTRTYHRMTVNIEDAGFEIRDQIQWIYASGFPKSLNVKKQLEKNGYKICECSKQNTEHDLRPLSETNISQTINTENEQGQTLLSQLPKQDIQVSEHTTSDVWREQSSVEGWSNTIQKEGQLQGDNIQESTGTLKADGEKGWLHNGAQIDNGSINKPTIDENRSGSSQRPQSEQQSSKQSGTMADKRRPQDGGSGKICSGCGKQIIDLTLGHTAMKPANEPICVARKPLSENTVAENVLKWGTGGINVDGCRVAYANEADEKSSIPGSLNSNQKNSSFGIGEGHQHNTEGRFPANIILECICDEVIKGEVKSNTREAGNSFNNYDDKVGKVVTRIENYGDKGDIHTNPNCPCYLMDEQSGVSKSSDYKYEGKDSSTKFGQIKSSKKETVYSDKGGASRFFYQAKVSKAERNMGLDLVEGKEVIRQGLAGENNNPVHKNSHPTVKPVSLMAYLCRLITPPNGIVLDPFMGSGSTGIAAQLEGFRFVGMEMDSDYFKIAEARIENYEKYK